MSITDELREWFENAYTYKTVDGNPFNKVKRPWFGWKSDIEEMLDRIDERHRRALEKVAAMVDEPDEKRSAYYDRFIAPMVDGPSLDALERRVEAIERKLNHRGER